MKLKSTFVTYADGGEQIMVATGGAGFSGLVRSNATAAFIVDALKQDTTVDAIVAAMMEEYDAPEDILRRDVENIVAKLRKIGALEE